MIEDWHIDPDTNDVAMDDAGNLLWAEGAERIRSQCQARLEIQRESWFRDMSVGVDWLDKVFGKSSDTVVQAEIVRELTAVPGVAKVDAVELALDSTRQTLSIIWFATTNDGIAIGGTVVG